MKILFCAEAFPEARTRLAALLPDDEILAFPPEKLGAHIAEADVVVPLVEPGGRGPHPAGDVRAYPAVRGRARNRGHRRSHTKRRHGRTYPERRVRQRCIGRRACDPSHAHALPAVEPDRTNTGTGHQGRVGVAGRPGDARENRLHPRPRRGRKGTGPPSLPASGSGSLPWTTIPAGPCPGWRSPARIPSNRLAGALAEADYVALCINYTPDGSTSSALRRLPQ